MGDRVTARSRSHALSQHPRTAAKVGSKGLVPPHRFPAGSPPGAPRTQEPRQSSPAGALGVVSGAPCPSCSLLPGGPLSPAPSPTHLCSFMLSITRPPPNPLSRGPPPLQRLSWPRATWLQAECPAPHPHPVNSHQSELPGLVSLWVSPPRGFLNPVALKTQGLQHRACFQHTPRTTSGQPLRAERWRCNTALGARPKLNVN